MVDPAFFTGVLGATDGDLLGRVIETWAVAQIRAEAATLAPGPADTDSSETPYALCAEADG